jgi:cation diffusion facilitator CzcD-associated flavoprotein CzcO
VLLADAGCTKSRANVEAIDADATDVAYQDAEAAYKAEMAELDKIYQERYNLVAEYRIEVDELCREDRKWVDAEKAKVEEARKQGDAAYRERRDLGLQHYYSHCDESRKKRDAITAAYIPRVKEVNDRIEAQTNRTSVSRASLDEAKLRN